jgi:hypothetical protein
MRAMMANTLQDMLQMGTSGAAGATIVQPSAPADSVDNAEGIPSPIQPEQKKSSSTNAEKKYEENGCKDNFRFDTEREMVLTNQCKYEKCNNIAVQTAKQGETCQQHRAASPKPPTTESTFTPEQRSAYPLTNIPKLGPNDCLFGRGGGTNHYPGNKAHRALVESRKELYPRSKVQDKPLVAMAIINDCRGLSPPGMFLKKNDRTK